MIQRIQTIWLALAAACGFAMANVPLFNATLNNQASRTILASESLLAFALIIGAACLAVVAIFLFKKRSVQYKMAIIGALLSIVIIALQVYQIEDFKKQTPIIQGNYQWGGLLPIAMMVFFFLASGGIRKDEKLIKSRDRLR